MTPLQQSERLARLALFSAFRNKYLGIDVETIIDKTALVQLLEVAEAADRVYRNLLISNAENPLNRKWAIEQFEETLRKLDAHPSMKGMKE